MLETKEREKNINSDIQGFDLIGYLLIDWNKTSKPTFINKFKRFTPYNNAKT